MKPSAIPFRPIEKNVTQKSPMSFRAALQRWKWQALSGVERRGFLGHPPPPDPKCASASPPPTSVASVMSSRNAAHANHYSPVQYFHQLQKLISARKPGSTDNVPFSHRWDNICASLRLLGNLSQGNTVKVYKDSGNAFQAMWSAVSHAQKEVLWQTYICKDDFVGKKTARVLLEAQRRGCTTELLYDAGGNISGRTKLTENLKKAGASVIVYRPFFSHLCRYLLTFDWRISPGLRNHRKILLVDDRIGFCGGLNVGNEYCAAHAGGSGRFRDTHCSVEGPALQHMRKVYDDTKQPQRSRFSWARWRQRAALQWSRTYRSGSNYINRIIKPLQVRTSSARNRGRMHWRRQLRYAQRQTGHFMERVDWQRKRSKSVKRSDPQRKPKSAAEDHLPRTSTELAEPALQSSELRSTVAAASDPPHSTLHRSDTRSATQRRVQVERYNLFAAMWSKRKATQALLQRQLLDTEQVPEALAYGRQFQPTTQILQSNPSYGDYAIQYAFWQVVRKCHRRVWVTTPYYLPSTKHVRAMIHAASRGVDVRVLTGSQTTTDPWFMWYASTYITGLLLHAGVRVFEYKGGAVMHAKTMVVDSIWSSVGSFNWDPMSNMNLEVCLCHFDVEMAKVMEGHFLEDLEKSEEIHLSTHHQRPLWQRAVSWLFYKTVFFLMRITFSTLSVPDLDYSYKASKGRPPSISRSEQ